MISPKKEISGLAITFSGSHCQGTSISSRTAPTSHPRWGRDKDCPQNQCRGKEKSLREKQRWKDFNKESQTVGFEHLKYIDK